MLSTAISLVITIKPKAKLGLEYYGRLPGYIIISKEII
jgi:hypothetical protein